MLHASEDYDSAYYIRLTLAGIGWFSTRGPVLVMSLL